MTGPTDDRTEPGGAEPTGFDQTDAGQDGADGTGPPLTTDADAQDDDRPVRPGNEGA